MKRIRRIFTAERGVAMVTVLFIGATLTAVTSMAAYTTIQNLRAVNDDRNGASALSLAEAGIDRLIQRLKDGTLNWTNVGLAGCVSGAAANTLGGPITIQGNLGRGSFSTSLVAYVPPTGGQPAKFAPDTAACPSTTTAPSARSNPYFAVTSTGSQPAASRVVRQILRVGGTTLPVGMFANDVDVSGSGESITISLMSDGSVRGRDKLHFTGLDPWYTLNDFYPGAGSGQIPAAVHALASINLTAAGATPEHLVANPNCDKRTNGANQQTDPGAGQSLWDGDSINQKDPLTVGCPSGSAWVVPSGYVGPAFPPRSTFTTVDLDRVAAQRNLTPEDYAALKDSAKSTGLYCTPQGNGISCLKAGTSTVSNNSSPQISTTWLSGLDQNYVVYIDFPSTTLNAFASAVTVSLTGAAGSGGVGACPDKVVTFIVRYGSLSISAGGTSNGAFLVPEGEMSLSGGATIEGTIIAKKLTKKGGSTVKLTACWINHMPGPWLTVTPATWLEVDR